MLRAIAAATVVCLFAASADSATTVAPLDAAELNEFPGDPLSAAQALLERVVPASLVPAFQLELIPPAADRSAVMQLSSVAASNTVVLRGSGGVELAAALNWYMNDYLNITYDWNTYAEGQWSGSGRFADVDAAQSLPLPPADGAVRPRQLGQSYYMNVRAWVGGGWKLSARAWLRLCQPATSFFSFFAALQTNQKPTQTS
jgi:hypothetical protein